MVSRSWWVDSWEYLAVLPRTFALAQRYKLTIYDAAYMELAERHDVPLATLDKRLAKAAVEHGLTLFHPPAA